MTAVQVSKIVTSTLLLRKEFFKHVAFSIRTKSTRKMSNMKDVERYEGEEESLTVIEEWLRNYPGGGVRLTLDHISGVAKLILDRPEKRNAMSGQMMAELGEAVKRLEAWHEGKAVVMLGSGKMFCSGGDLEFARSTGDAKGGYRMATYMHNVLSRLRNLPMVSVAVMHGSGALGGGAELALSCDWRLMTKDCSGIGVVHSRMGIVPAWGATTRLTELLGRSRALDVILTGRVFPPTEALAIGLVDHLLDDPDQAEEWLGERIKCCREVVRAAKETVAGCHARLGNEEDALEHERRLFAPLWGGPANREALDSRRKHL